MNSCKAQLLHGVSIAFRAYVVVAIILLGLYALLECAKVFTHGAVVVILSIAGVALLALLAQFEFGRRSINRARKSGTPKIAWNWGRGWLQIDIEPSWLGLDAMFLVFASFKLGPAFRKALSSPGRDTYSMTALTLLAVAYAFVKLWPKLNGHNRTKVSEPDKVSGAESAATADLVLGPACAVLAAMMCFVVIPCLAGGLFSG